MTINQHKYCTHVVRTYLRSTATRPSSNSRGRKMVGTKQPTTANEHTRKIRTGTSTRSPRILETPPGECKLVSTSTACHGRASAGRTSRLYAGWTPWNGRNPPRHPGPVLMARNASRRTKIRGKLPPLHESGTDRSPGLPST